ncbi:MAG: glycosyltransferase family 39 protein, partial [bacterium]|nr:glycosyltransferase family 39 protein [bacterium]
IFAGLLIRLFLARYETEVGVDSVHYILMGNNIASGVGIDTWNTTGGRWILPPTFPLLVAFFRLFGIGLEWSGHLASVTAGTALLIPIYFLTRRLFSVTTARAALWIAVFTPILVDYSVVILTENLFAAFVLAMLIFTHRAYSSDGKLTDSFISGIFASLAFLTKTFGIFLVPFLLLSYLFSRGGHSKSSPVKQTILAFIGFMILAAPYWVVLHNHTGQWMIDGKGLGQENRIFAGNLTEEHNDPRYTGELTDDGSDFAINVNPSSQNPSQTETGKFLFNFCRKYTQKLVRIYQDFPFTPTYPNNVLLLYLFPTILLGLGIFNGPGRWKERDSDRFLLFWLCPFVFCVPLIFVEVRYFIPVIPLLIPFMARGVEEIADWTMTRFSGTWKFLAKNQPGRVVTIFLIIFALLAIPKLTYKITNWSDPLVSYNPRKVAAQWLLNNGYHPSRIMEYGHSVSFYSGAQSILIPKGDLDDVIRIARKYDADLLSLDEFFVLRSHRRPEIEFLFNTDLEPPPELERIYVDDQFNELHHVIYRIRLEDETENLTNLP